MASDDGAGLSRPRVLALLVVAGCHGLLLLLPWHIAIRAGATTIAPILLIDLPAAVPEPARANLQPAPGSRPEARRLIRSPEAPRSSAEASSAPQALPPIDWDRERERSVQAPPTPGAAMPNGLAPRLDLQLPSARAPQHFAWSHAHTHRLEPIPSGGTLIWLNDRCAIAVLPIPFPVCSLGRMPAQGDLFRDMGKPRDAGELP